MAKKKTRYAAWVAAGFGVFLSGNDFWQGAWVGGSVVLWLGYVPALVYVIRLERMRGARARSADQGRAR